MDHLRKIFNEWGISHYLARSGLHMILFILIWTMVLQFLPVHISVKRVAIAALCIIYSILTWPSISFCRSFFVFLLCQVGMIVNFQVNFLHLLTTTCLLILLFNPIQLFFLDFQLTFSLSFALVWLSRKIQYRSKA